MRKLIFTISAFLALSLSAQGQKWSMSTNVIDWAALGTANIEGQVSLAQHISIVAGARFNP